MKGVSALSTVRNTDAALDEVIERAATDLEGEPADLALVFTSMHHAKALGKIVEAIRARGLGRHVLGCTGESIVGEDREIEGSAALSLLSLRMPGVTLEPFRLSFNPEDGFSGWPGAAADTGTRPAMPAVLLLADPFTFPADQFLKAVNDESPGSGSSAAWPAVARSRARTSWSSTARSSRTGPSPSHSTARWISARSSARGVGRSDGR